MSAVSSGEDVIPRPGAATTGGTGARVRLSAWPHRVLGLMLILMALTWWHDATDTWRRLRDYERVNAAYQAQGLRAFASRAHLQAKRVEVGIAGGMTVLQVVAGAGLIVPWRWARWLAAILCVVNALFMLFIPWALPTNDEAVGAERTHIGYAVGCMAIWLALACHLMMREKIRAFILQRWPPALNRAFRGRWLWGTLGWVVYLLGFWFLMMGQQMLTSAYYRWTRSFW